ncbi:Histidine kinase-, DNA gyrase B-, and HSP90-like ATPase [Amphibacillus marinus]|uniref:histidine kinase n=1 Tax=Amphibacillus marinus TaxID=872970 RepID=A0A1H8L633_9BACI|nr:sensor histidine kinase [Amphibacillus marinus]SEO00286.1 Histidine kinase-, DNA gyrase B-, and HSP90-like ATPase [Amphibacillus marinus]
MTTIQKKIITLTTIMLLVMLTIWLMMTFYNRQSLDKYNGILQRYLVLNDVNETSQQLLTELNNYLTAPSEQIIASIEEHKAELGSNEQEVWSLAHVENQFDITNYINLMDSLIETIDRSIILDRQQDPEAALSEFTDATRITNYISETTLALVDQELKTYDTFYRSIIEQSAALNQFGIWLLLWLTFSLIVVTYTLSRSITRPINQLTEAANALSRGEFDSEVEVDSNDEISFLARTFNRMRININTLISEIQLKAQLEKELQESKLLLQESQFKSLQSQINPHFLFNTLNTISKKAYLEQALETSDLLVNIAGLLRYNLKQLDRSVTLYDEVTVLKQYIDIQRARFTDRLNFFEQIDEQLLTVPIPALTIQPIIENAIIHAIEPNEDGGNIYFRIADQDDRVLIEIEDNGPGMSKEKIEQLLSGSIMPKEGHSTGIGFTNVVKRLRIFYNCDHLIEIQSELNKGTTISLRLPKQRG